MLSRIGTERPSALGRESWRKPLIYPGRLRIFGNAKARRQSVYGVTLESLSDGLAVKDSPTKMAPHLAEGRRSQNETNLLFSGFCLAHRNEIDTRERNGSLDGRVQIRWQESHDPSLHEFHGHKTLLSMNRSTEGAQ